MKDTSSPLVFGTPDPGLAYKPRPGAYALIQAADGRFAITLERGRHFLPGGGIDLGESPKEALLREIREECGHHARIIAKLGEADMYYVHREQGPVLIHAHWFTAEFVEPTNEPCEKDCELVWMTEEEAAARLYREAERWLVRNFASLK